MSSKRVDFIIAKQLVDNFNRIVLTADGQLSLMIGKLQDGSFYTDDINVLREDIARCSTFILKTSDNLDVYKTKRQISINLESYSSKDLVRYDNEKQTIKLVSIASNEEAIKAANFNVLTVKAVAFENPIELASPVIYENSYSYANIINDLLDASSYVLRNINPETGDITTLTDEEIRQKVKSYLIQLSNFIVSWPNDVTDADNMVDIADSVLADLSTISFETLAQRIVDNVPKLPLIRRNWAD